VDVCFFQEGFVKSRWIAAGCGGALVLVSAFLLAYERASVRARLTGFQEVPAISTFAGGEFRARIGESQIDYVLTISDLGPEAVLFAHIHLGQRGVNGGIVAFLCGGGGKDPCPQDGGTVSGTILPADIIGPSAQGITAGEFAEAVRAIRSGNTYVNVHTDDTIAPTTTPGPEGFPAGEIRGQIRTDSETNPD
jgi:hypothetical protein